MKSKLIHNFTIDGAVIREQLIDAIHGVEIAKKYFGERFDDPDLNTL